MRANEDVTQSKTTQLPVGKTPSRATKLKRKRRGRGSAFSRKPSNKSPSPESFHPVCVTIVDNPGITDIIAQIAKIRIKTSELLSVLTTRNRFFKESQAGLTLWVTPLSKNHFPFSLVISNLGTRFFLRGVGRDAPGF
jgi:hypothetical protein